MGTLVRITAVTIRSICACALKRADMAAKTARQDNSVYRPIPRRDAPQKLLPGSILRIEASRLTDAQAAIAKTRGLCNTDLMSVIRVPLVSRRIVRRMITPVTRAAKTARARERRRK